MQHDDVRLAVTRRTLSGLRSSPTPTRRRAVGNLPSLGPHSRSTDTRYTTPNPLRQYPLYATLSIPHSIYFLHVFVSTVSNNYSKIT